MSKTKRVTEKTVETLKHDEAKRKNIPTAEYQSLVNEDDPKYLKVAYERRNKDLDPQLVWRGKDVDDWSNLVAQAPPLYIQEKVHPKALIDDLIRQSKQSEYNKGYTMADLFSDFNGIPYGVNKTEFYKHDQHWSNRMILGDSLQVMASLAERERLKGQVQCIYFDPPYGIKFNSNFQWSTTTRDVKDGKIDHITREPEQVKAFRDTWRDGIHSYLTYLRDRLTVARDLLTDSGSIFVQIGDENVHRVRALMDEVFGESNFVSLISFKKTVYQATDFLPNIFDYIIWYCRDKQHAKVRQLLQSRDDLNSFDLIKDGDGLRRASEEDRKSSPDLLLRASDMTSKGASEQGSQPYNFQGKEYSPKVGNHWKTHVDGIKRLEAANRLIALGKTLCFRKMAVDYPVTSYSNVWTDTVQSTFASENIYVVQTYSKVVARCVLMATDPGDLVLDPTCGSGTTAYVSEQWGRRWITIDTSRVALALARARIMGARYPFYLLSDSREGQIKESEIARRPPSTAPVHGNIRQGFVYDRVPHITLKSIANNTEIDVIEERWQEPLRTLCVELNRVLKKNWKEWEIPQQISDSWSTEAKNLHSKWWETYNNLQHDIDASIASKAEFEYLYEKPYEDKKRVRVAGPFTVESVSPHRALGVDENDELIDPLKKNAAEDQKSFVEMILENLKTSGVQQAHKEDKIDFTSIEPWPGDMICAEARYMEGTVERRAAIFVGSEFGTMLRSDLVEAAREAGDAAFDVLISCAFSYEAHTTDFNNLGRITVLKARMNADLHMAGDLKNTGKGNLFVIFGEPEIEILPSKDGQVQVKIKGVDVFKPSTGEVVSNDRDGIACWFVDTDYNNESFFVRHAYFLGANDPYNSLKNSLKAEINREAWETLHSDISRPFPKPTTGRIAVKVINHLGDEVMKVFKVS